MKKLFCIPGGAASAVMYLPWKRYMRDYLNICLLEIPGRGIKQGQPFVPSLHLIAKDMVDEIKNNMEEDDFYLFGYCMGATLVYEVCRILEKEGERLPKRVICCGSAAPGCTRCQEPILGRKECRQEMQDMLYRFFPGYLFGKGKELENIAQLYAQILFDKFDKTKQIQPVLRDDFDSYGIKVNDKKEQENIDNILQFANNMMSSFSNDQKMIIDYNTGLEDYRMNCNLTVIDASQDTIVPEEEKKRWRNYAKEYRVLRMKANHFTLTGNTEMITKIVLNEILENG